VPEPSSAAGLSQARCVPCEGGVTALSEDEVRQYHEELGTDWNRVDTRRLEKEYRFVNFVEAMQFANRIGELAEAEGHHPDLLVGWGRVKVYLWTHAADGLTKNDFILAAKISQLNLGS